VCSLRSPEVWAVTQTECHGCGLNVYDLPHEAADPEAVRDLFFDFDDAGELYCQGCAAVEGTWL
jgi:hypothetical protein